MPVIFAAPIVIAAVAVTGVVAAPAAAIVAAESDVYVDQNRRNKTLSEQVQDPSAHRPIEDAVIWQRNDCGEYLTTDGRKVSHTEMEERRRLNISRYIQRNSMKSPAPVFHPAVLEQQAKEKALSSTPDQVREAVKMYEALALIYDSMGQKQRTIALMELAVACQERVIQLSKVGPRTQVNPQYKASDASNEASMDWYGVGEWGVSRSGGSNKFDRWKEERAREQQEGVAHFRQVLSEPVDKRESLVYFAGGSHVHEWADKSVDDVAYSSTAEMSPAQRMSSSIVRENMLGSSSLGVVHLKPEVSAEKKLLTAADEIAWRPAQASLLPPRTRSYVNPENESDSVERLQHDLAMLRTLSQDEPAAEANLRSPLSPSSSWDAYAKKGQRGSLSSNDASHPRPDTRCHNF